MWASVGRILLFTQVLIGHKIGAWFEIDVHSTAQIFRAFSLKKLKNLIAGPDRVQLEIDVLLKVESKATWTKRNFTLHNHVYDCSDFHQAQ